MPERISEGVADTLRKLNVDIQADSRVTEVTGEGVKLANGKFIPSELVVWAAGVKGPRGAVASRRTRGQPVEPARRPPIRCRRRRTEHLRDGRLRLSRA
ncbi:MAG: FAD-dependent oxidoreductase [Hyphomicrobium sp.]